MVVICVRHIFISTQSIYIHHIGAHSKLLCKSKYSGINIYIVNTLYFDRFFQFFSDNPADLECRQHTFLEFSGFCESRLIVTSGTGVKISEISFC